MPVVALIIGMILTAFGGYLTASSGGVTKTGYKACQPNLEVNQWVTVDVARNRETRPNGQPLYKDKEDKLWLLIKTDAPIPAWKVWGGAGKERDGITIGEMEAIGVVDGSASSSVLGKEVFVGIGHCDGDPQKECLDPLVQDALFVPTQEGAKPPLSGCMTRWPDAASPECEKEAGYWWGFNVYVDASSLPPNPTNDDLPCWARLACGQGDVMGENRKKVWEEYLKTGVCNLNLATVKDNRGFIQEAATTGVATLPSFIQKKNIDFSDPSFDQSKLSDVYWYEQKVSQNPEAIGAVSIGTYSYQPDLFEIYYLEKGNLLIISPLPGKDQFHSYVPLTKVVRPDAKSLQLGTFFPVKSFSYEWWTPACKPAIYLYPEEKTQVSVKVKPQGKITESIPEHGEKGWRVVAYPNSVIRIQNSEFSKPTTDNRQLTTEYPYLYYEAELEKVKVPEQGWIVEKQDLESFFNTILPQLALNSKEQQDFLAYWIPKLDEYLATDNKEQITELKTPRGWQAEAQAKAMTPPTVEESDPKLFIGLIDRQELDRVEPIEFTPQPDTFIRVRFYFEKIGSAQDTSDGSKATTSALLNIITPTRQGFVAVDWGGILENGTCGEGEISE